MSVFDSCHPPQKRRATDGVNGMISIGSNWRCFEHHFSAPTGIAHIGQKPVIGYFGRTGYLETNRLFEHNLTGYSIYASTHTWPTPRGDCEHSERPTRRSLAFGHLRLGRATGGARADLTKSRVEHSTPSAARADRKCPGKQTVKNGDSLFSNGAFYSTVFDETITDR